MLRKSNKNNSGGMLLEVLFMVAILMVIFPMLQKNVKNKSDALRNSLVVKDMMRLKTSLENYLKASPDIPMGVSDIKFDVLKKYGLPQDFKTSNIIGQNYRVKIKRSLGADVSSNKYDAIVIADGNSEIPDMRIREIVKASKGYGGYLEDDVVYGLSWVLDAQEWGNDVFGTDSIVFKSDFAKKNYQYIARVKGVGSSTMETDLYMNLNDIIGVKTFDVMNVVIRDIKSEPDSETNVDRVSVDEDLTLEDNMEMLGQASVILPYGIDQKSINFNNDGVIEVYLNNTLRVLENLKVTGEGFDSSNFRFVDIESLLVPTTLGGLELFVKNLIQTPAQSSIPVEFGIVNLTNVNIETKLSDGQWMTHSGISRVGFVFDRIESNKSLKYNITSSDVNLSDIIVKNVNKVFNGRKIGGIDITEQTPLSVILRALSYEYADIYRLVHNTYDGMEGDPSIDPMPGLKYPEYERCTKYECKGGGGVGDNPNWSY